MKRLFLIAAAALAFAGCNKKEECNYDECAVKASATEIANVKAYLTQNNISAQEHCSGVFYAIDSVGKGAAANPCSYISFRYKGMLTNGSVFDQSTTPTQYMKMTNLIRGWVNTLPKLRQGGGMRVYIPPTLGYGGQDVKDANNNVRIPANSILIFEVKLDGVQ